VLTRRMLPPLKDRLTLFPRYYDSNQAG
jgi:hypothetical protein